MKKTLTILGLLILVIISAFTFEFIDDSILRSSHPKKYSEFVEKYSEIYNVPESVIYSVIRTESSFKSDAVSKKGAIGLMQITPETFEWLCTKTGEEFNKTLLYDPDTNIKYGTYFLSMLQLEFVSWDTVFAAYNAGRTTVNKWLSDERYNNNGRLMNIPYKETENYVKKVNNAVEVYERLYYKNSENVSERT